MAKIIMGIRMEKRRDSATAVQDVLTEYGCFIKTRIGLHDASDDRTVCAESGIVLLELIRDAEIESGQMVDKLGKIDGVNVKTMAF